MTNFLWHLATNKTEYIINPKNMPKGLTDHLSYVYWELLIFKTRQNSFLLYFLTLKQKKKISEFSSSPKGSSNNDLALLKIQRKGDGSGIQLSSSVAPACLPLDDTPQKPGTACTVSGWGQIDGESLLICRWVLICRLWVIVVDLSLFSCWKKCPMFMVESGIWTSDLIKVINRYRFSTIHGTLKNDNLRHPN